MSDNEGQEDKPMARDQPEPNLATNSNWGPEYVPHEDFIRHLWNTTHWGTQEERDEHVKVAKERVIPILSRCLEVNEAEQEDAFAVWRKYHEPGTGVRDTLIKDFDTLMNDTESRMPLLWLALKRTYPTGPRVINHYANTFQKNGLFVAFNSGFYTMDEVTMQLQSDKATRDLLLKKVALMKDQSDALTRALVENGIQLPQECAAIREQLHGLKHFEPDDYYPDYPKYPSLGTPARPKSKLLSLSQSSSGSSFTGIWENLRDRRAIDAERASAGEMAKAQLEDLLKALHEFECGRFFETPLITDDYHRYFTVVREHRDLVTIKDSLSRDPQYGALEFFGDIKLMLGNYSYFFGENSPEHQMALILQQEMWEKLEDYGEAGQRAKTQFNETPWPEFSHIMQSSEADTASPPPEADTTLPPPEADTAFPPPEADATLPQSEVDAAGPPPEVDATLPPSEADATLPPSEADGEIDNSVDESEIDTSYAQGINKDHEENHGEGGDDSYLGQNDVLVYDDGQGPLPQTPGTVGPARTLESQDGLANQSPGVTHPADQSLGEDERVQLSWGDMDVATQWNQAHGLPTRAPAGLGRAQPQNDEDGRDSPSLVAFDTAGQSGNQDDQGPGGRPSPDINKPAEQPEESSIVNPYSSSPVASGPVEQNDDKDSDILSSIASPNPSPVANPAAAASEPGDGGAHASAHTLEQSAPVASLHVEREIIDLTASSPPRQTSKVDSSSTKRARATDDQESSSDDDAPLIKRRKTTTEPSSDGAPLPSKRQKTAAKSTGYAVTSSLGKRSRDESDDEGDEDRGQPSKRNKASPVLEPQAPAAAAAGDDGPQHTSLTIDELFAPFDSPPPPVQGSPRPRTVATAAQGDEPSLASYQNRSTQNVIEQDALLPPSPIPEPFTPPAAATEGPGSVSPPHMLDGTETGERANNVSGNEGHDSRPASSSPIAAADEPQPEPATVDLGHTNNGSTTASKLQKLPKYKKKRGSNGRGRPSRPWVFGHRFGNDYGLYIMSCPKKGCETGVEVFTTHPLMRNDAADHLQECAYEFADDDDMVRKYGTQVISDDRKTVSIEWARNWNNELMKEYGNEELEEDNF